MHHIAWATKQSIFALLTLTTLAGLPANAADPPAYMQAISGAVASSPAETATKNVLALNIAMFGLYDAAGRVFQKNILAQHPVILGLFSGAGGRFILYRPGMTPLEAPSVPIVYQLLKSVGHSVMALSEVVAPYLDNTENKSWRGPLLAYRSEMQTALETLDATDMPADWRANSRTMLQNNAAFMDACAERGAISMADLQTFAHEQAAFLKKEIAWAAETQVDHWMGVIAEWKKLLGSDWDKTYAASNTIYVARQNNVLFSVLAQFFGPNAINSRLMLIETISFTTTPEDMLEFADPDYCGPFGRRPLLWQLLSDGLRVDGRECAEGNRCPEREIRHEAILAAGGALRFASVANPDHPWTRPQLARRSEVNRNAP